METSKDVYSRHKIIAVTSLKIMKWFGYSHLEEIIVRRQDDQLYKFREGDFKRLRRQDIEDMLLLLVQDKLTNLNLEERRMTPYTVYPDIQGIIYEDERNRNRLMHTDELHKFSDGILNHVRTALNDIALGIEMDQNQRDLPRDIPLDSVVFLRYEKRSKSENKGKVPTEMELVLEQTQQEFQERCLIQAFKTKKQQQYEHVGSEVTRSQEAKRSQDNDMRLFLVDDLKEVRNHIHINSKTKVNAYYINLQVKD
ncbi:hypothetical protein Tco_1540014 [Tanacetum coccineum]